MVSKSDSGDASTLGANVGSNTKTLTVNNLPSHTHTYSKANNTTESTTLTVNQIPSHSHATEKDGNQIARWANYNANGTAPAYINSGANTHYEAMTTGNTGGSQGHNHSITLTAVNSGATGSASAINVMQNSKVCIRWHRTA